MIIAPDFVWLHFPKCAGTATRKALTAKFTGVEGWAFDQLGMDVPQIGHHSIPKRKEYDPTFDLGDRRVLCNFRRLPNWILSRVHFEASRTPFHVASREMFEGGHFFERQGNVNHADNLVEQFATEAETKWIRTEHLADDLSEAVGEPIEVATANERTYVRDLGFWFTPAELDALYAACPKWAELERSVYGELISL